MSLTLELSPVQETELQDAAQQEGMPVGDYAHQLFSMALRQRIPLRDVPHEKTNTPVVEEPLDWQAELKWAQEEAQKAFIASGKTEEEVIADTEAAVDAHRAEVYARKQRESNS